MEKLFLLLISFSFISILHSCSVVDMHGSLFSGPQGELSNTSYSEKNFLDNFIPFKFEYKHSLKSSYFCVDARETRNVLGTPGGDFGELMVAIVTYFNVTNKDQSNDTVKEILHAFLNDIATPERPFYYHTDGVNIDAMISEIERETGFEFTHTIFPYREPKGKDTWLTYIQYPQYQGCGHLRLIMTYPNFYNLPNAHVPTTLLVELVKWYWNASFIDKKKVDFAVLHGPQEARGLAIVSKNGTAPNCEDYSPAYSPNFSDTFLYHRDSVLNFRKKVITPFIKKFDSTVNGDVFYERYNEIADYMVSATISKDSPGFFPLNALNIFSLTITSKDDEVLTPNESQLSPIIILGILISILI